jgi:hypothetical protein
MADTSWTIRKAQNLGLEVNGICDACNALFEYDMAKLGEAYGLDTPLPDRIEAGCPNCQADLRIVLASPGRPAPDDA